MTLWRVRSLITSTISGDDLSTLYFDSTSFSSIAAGYAAEQFWTQLQPAMWSGAHVTIEPDIYEINPTTGSIMSVAPYGGGYSAAGTDSSDPLPLDAQGLIRWSTGEWVSGRALKGSTYVPYATTGANAAGKPSATYRGHLATAATYLQTAAPNKFVIWSRTHHLAYPVSGHDVWTQWASLGKRRF